MNHRDQTMRLKQSIKRMKTLMKNIQKWSYVKRGHGIRGQWTARLKKESSGYIKHENLRLWPHVSRICTCVSDSVLKKLDCSSKSRDQTVQEDCEYSVTRMLMTSAMSWEDQVARIPMEHPTEGSRFQSQPKKTWSWPSSHSTISGDVPLIGRLWECEKTMYIY